MSNLADCLHKWLDDECPTSALLARELGIHMPYQLEVVGFDNLRVGKSCIPPFSTTNLISPMPERSPPEWLSSR